MVQVSRDVNWMGLFKSYHAHQQPTVYDVKVSLSCHSSRCLPHILLPNILYWWQSSMGYDNEITVHLRVGRLGIKWSWVWWNVERNWAKKGRRVQMKWRSCCHISYSEWGFCRLSLAVTSLLLQHVDGSLPSKACLVVTPVYVKKSWCGCLLVAFEWLPLEWFNSAYVLTLSIRWLWLI